MVRVLAFTVALLVAATTVARADCLTRSQNAIAAVQIVNAYTISRYGWEGDRHYDQGMPYCGSHPGLVEFGCNAAVNVGIRIAEDTALAHADERTRNRVCVANYIGALAFSLYIRHAIGVQILGRRN